MNTLNPAIPKKLNIKVYIALSIIAFLFVFFRSYATSPLYKDIAYDGGRDSFQVMVIAKSWLAGKLPYRDIFDHKGPYFYFMNLAGFFLAGNSKAGIFILQIINMFFVSTGIYRLSLINNKDDNTKVRLIGILSVIASLLIFQPTYVSGDMCEEWSLPFIVYSTYFQMSYLLNQIDEHYMINMFYGFSFGICFLSKITSGVTIFSVFLIILLLKLYKKEFKIFLKIILEFTAGFIISVIPFTLYFIYHKSFYDFLFGTLLFNIKYNNGSASWVLNQPITNFFEFFSTYFGYTALILSILILFLRKKYFAATACIISFLLESYLFFSGAGFPQYMQVTIAQFPFLLSLIFNESTASLIKIRKYLYCYLAILLFASLFDISSDVYHNYMLKDFPEAYEELVQLIPESELSSTVAYGENWTKSFYLKYDVIPYYKYFTIQNWHAKFDPETEYDIIKTYEKGDAKWIISDSREGILENVLSTRYDEIASNSDYILYKSK